MHVIININNLVGSYMMVFSMQTIAKFLTMIDLECEIPLLHMRVEGMQYSLRILFCFFFLGWYNGNSIPV